MLLGLHAPALALADSALGAQGVQKVREQVQERVWGGVALQLEQQQEGVRAEQTWLLWCAMPSARGAKKAQGVRGHVKAPTTHHVLFLSPPIEKNNDKKHTEEM